VHAEWQRCRITYRRLGGISQPIGRPDNRYAALVGAGVPMMFDMAFPTQPPTRFHNFS
jgi:hypothetical protein